MSAGDVERIPERDLAAAAADILAAAGASAENARAAGEALADADAAGRASHGTRQVEAYVARLLAGEISGSASPAIVEDGGGLLRIDGRHCFGQVVGAFAARLGAERAKRHGICLLAIDNATHLGRNARWPELAAAEGVASLHFGHGFGPAPTVAPHGGTAARLRTSPIALGVPGLDGEPLVLDFSVAELSLNSVKLLAERGESLPPRTAVKPDGFTTDDPRAVLNGEAALLPFGAFKGYGLAVFAEIFAGIIAAQGARRPGSNAMLSIYFQVAKLANENDYRRRLADFLDSLRTSPVPPGAPAVTVPGDRSRRARAEAAISGVPMTGALRRSLAAAADRAGVAREVRRRWHPLLASS